VQSGASSQFLARSERHEGLAGGAIPRKARNAEWRTPTSRNPGKSGCRVKASRVDG
jgi:hypothetical protein